MRKKTKTEINVFQIATSCYLGLMMTVFLFYTGRFGFQGIADAKYSVFLIVCGGYVACMLLLMAEMALIGKFRFPSLRRLFDESSWLQRLMTVYLAMTWISALLSPHFPTTVIGATRDEGALTITIYVLSFLLVSVYGQIEKWMLPVLALSVSVFDIISILQLFGRNPFALYPEGYDYFGANVHYSGAYLGTIGNVDLVAAFLCIVIPVFWVSLVRCRDKRRWLLLIPLGLSLFVLLKMWVLAGLIGVFAGGAVALCAVLPVSDKVGKWLWLLLGCSAALLLALVFFVDAESGLFHEIHLLLHGRGEGTFGSGRIHIWQNVLERIPQQFWLGSGPDTMQLAQLEPFSRYHETLDLMLVAEIDLAHNEYLNILFHQGVFALLAYLAALFLAAVEWLRCSRRNGASAAVGSAVLCYCVQAFFGFSLCMVSPYFWIMLAFLEITKKLTINGGSENGKKIA